MRPRVVKRGIEDFDNIEDGKWFISLEVLIYY